MNNNLSHNNNGPYFLVKSEPTALPTDVPTSQPTDPPATKTGTKLDTLLYPKSKF